MADWRFRCYVVEDNGVVLDKWKSDHEGDDKLLAKLDTRLRFLRQQPRDKWKRPGFDTLSGKYAELGELRIEYRNVQYRFLGFASGREEYTWLIVFTKKGHKLDPRDAYAIALRRMRAVLADRSLARDCDVD